MHPERSLSRLVAKLCNRTDRLRALASALKAPCSPIDERTCGYVVIEALTAWSMFARSWVISAALGAKDDSGVAHASALTAPVTPADVVIAAAGIDRRSLGRGGPPRRVTPR